MRRHGICSRDDLRAMISDDLIYAYITRALRPRRPTQYATGEEEAR